MTRLAQRLKCLPARLGWMGGVGLALVLAGTILSLTLAMPLRNKNIRIRGEIADISDQIRKRASIPTEVTTERRLAEFAAALPLQETLNEHIKALHNIAAKHGLALRNGEYRPESNPTRKFGQLRISLRTEGSYADLRRFLSDAMLQMPSLALDRCNFSRPRIEDTRVEAVVEFTLYYS